MPGKFCPLTAADSACLDSACLTAADSACLTAADSACLTAADSARLTAVDSARPPPRPIRPAPPAIWARLSGPVQPATSAPLVPVRTCGTAAESSLS